MKQKLIFLLGLAITCHLQAQLTLCKPSRLSLQIDNQDFLDRTRLFTSGPKLVELNKLTGGTQPEAEKGFNMFEFFYDLNELMKMGNGMRIYFAAYTLTDIDPSDQVYATGRTNRLVPVFVPTTEKKVGNDYINVDKPDTYFILDVINKTGLREIKPATGKAWIKNYYDVVLPKLNTTFTGTDSYGDTQSLWYNNKDLAEWRDEMICQHKQTASPVNTIHFFWATYAKNCTFYTGVSKPTLTTELATAGRLTLLFQLPDALVAVHKERQELLRKRANAIYQQNLNKAKSLKFNIQKKNTNQKALGAPFPPPPPPPSGEYDTGVPCPPAENCATGK
jgi:hypothetical protein